MIKVFIKCLIHDEIIVIYLLWRGGHRLTKLRKVCGYLILILYASRVKIAC